MDIILYLLQHINDQRKIIGQLLYVVCRCIPLKQWSFDDSHSPKYQKYKIDQLPRIISFQQEWNWEDLIPYYQGYHKTPWYSDEFPVIFPLLTAVQLATLLLII